MMARRKTRPVYVGSVQIGGGAPISIQSMTNTKTADVISTVAQIRQFEEAGCDILRITVNNQEAAEGFAEIRKQTNLPLVADIHFDYKMALAAIYAGANKIRINPGNIGGHERVQEIVAAAKSANVAIRVGVNGGSLQKDLLKKYGHPTPQALVDSAIRYAELMDELNFDQFLLSIKSTDVISTVEACSILADACPIPQHIGITESGTRQTGTIKSAAGLGALLSRGIGDTMRVSLAGDPIPEIAVAREILKAFDLHGGPKLIACPTCGRTEIDLAGLAEKVEERLSAIQGDITVAVMGCVVNGPGEAKEADVGVAGGKGHGLLFVKGEVVKKVPEVEILDQLMDLVERVIEEKNAKQL